MSDLPCCSPELSALLGRRVTRRALVGSGMVAGLRALVPDSPGVARAEVQGPFRGPADTIFWGGPILTMTDSQPVVDAIAVRNGRIVAVGDTHSVEGRRGPDTSIIELAGRTLMPGFVESHVHVLPTALVTQDVDVTPFTTSTFQEAIGKIQAALGAAAPGAWVPAFGYDPSLIQGPAQITRADLDPISPNNPVFILNLSGHLAYANSKALEAAGVTNQTTDPAGGGRFLRDATGQLTGVIEEVPAINRFVPLLPKPSATELAGLVAGVLHKAAAAGCTTLNDAGLGTTLGTAEVDTLREILQSTNSPVRMTAFLAGLLFDEWKKLSWFTPGAGDERFRAVKIKYWADGSTQGYTAALEQPYLNSTGTGFLNYSSDQLQTAVSEAVGDGWPVAIHCNGDAAVEQALGIFERIVSDSPKTGHHRIEHCSLASQDQLERIKRLGVSPTFLMNHVYYWGRVFRDEILGPERAAALDPVNSCLKLGLSFSLHSDSFTTPIAPLTYVQTAVTRIMRDGGEVLGPDERIGVAEALKAVTIYPAGQLGIDALTGSLEIGKYADLALLDQDPSVADPNAIGAIRVLETWLGGERRYSAAG